jgi:hypothetical protein
VRRPRPRLIRGDGGGGGKALAGRGLSRRGNPDAGRRIANLKIGFRHPYPFGGMESGTVTSVRDALDAIRAAGRGVASGSLTSS